MLDPKVLHNYHGKKKKKKEKKKHFNTHKLIYCNISSGSFILTGIIAENCG